MVEECKIDEVAAAQARFTELNDLNALQAEHLLIAVDNAIEVSRAMGQTQLGGLDHTTYRECFTRRIGSEAVVRIAMSLAYDMLSAGISIAHVCSEEPAFFYECLRDAKMLVYYHKYPKRLPTAKVPAA
jgi:hypothetical protein